MEPTLVPQWLRSGHSGSSNQQGRENGWQRSRQGDSSSSVDLTSKATNAKSRFEYNGRAFPHPEPGHSRRPSDRSRQRSQGFGSRPGSFGFRGDLFDDREPTSNGGSYFDRSESRALSRSFSEGNRQQAQRGAHRGRADSDFGGERDNGKFQRHHHHHSRSVCSRDPTERDFGLGFEGRFGGGLHSERSSGSASARQREPGKDNFEKNFPSLSADAPSSPAERGNGSWSGSTSVSQSSGRWNSKLAEAPPAPSPVYRQESPSETPSPVQQGPPSARMADAVQQKPADPVQNVVAEKQRLEVEQSRRLIPVMANPGRGKGAQKSGGGGAGRGRNDRETFQKFNNMVSGMKKMEDGQKDSTVVLGKTTGVLPRKNMVLVEASQGVALNGPGGHNYLPIAEGDVKTRPTRTRGESRDFTATQEKLRQQEREQNRMHFFNYLRRISTGGGNGGGQPVAEEDAVTVEQPVKQRPLVKRTVSEPSVRLATRVAAPQPSLLDSGDVMSVETENSVPNEADEDCVVAESGAALDADIKLNELQVNMGVTNKMELEHGDDWHLCLPSAEEERFLRSLGWSPVDEDESPITEEEIAAFKAKCLKKREFSSDSVAQKSLNSFQIGPVGVYSNGLVDGSIGTEFSTSDSDDN